MKKNRKWAFAIAGALLAAAVVFGLLVTKMHLPLVAALFGTIFFAAFVVTALYNTMIHLLQFRHILSGAENPSEAELFQEIQKTENAQQETMRQFQEDQMRMHQQAVSAHQQFMDQVQQQRHLDFALQNITSIPSGGFVPDNIHHPMF